MNTQSGKDLELGEYLSFDSEMLGLSGIVYLSEPDNLLIISNKHDAEVTPEDFLEEIEQVVQWVKAVKKDGNFLKGILK